MKRASVRVWENLQQIRAVRPVVHNITNYVVMNSTANALLALGASPVMAHAREEVADMVGIASALVINIGTLSRDWVVAMGQAMAAARRRGVPIIFDPVGAGATAYRTRTALALIRAVPPKVIRGNASEIMALADSAAKTKGVDSLAGSGDALEAAPRLSFELDTVICVSGEVDYIVQADRIVRVNNGHPLMPRVTGLGCAATALCGAFAAVEPDPLAAAACAMAVMGIAGEIAGEGCPGPGSFQVRFLDALYGLTERDMMRLKMETG